MAENLQNCLHRLHATVDQQYAGRAVEASSIVKDIVSICLDAVGDLGFHVSLLFNFDYGILKFLLDTVKTREFENARADLLQFLSILVTEHGDTILFYATELKNLFLRLLALEPSTKVKVENFNLMSQLLGQKASSTTKDFDASGIGMRIVTAFEQSSRETSTARAALYQLVGVLSERFPEYVTDKNDRIFTVIMSFLKKEMMATQKKPDQVVIAGCFRGLKGLLTHFTQTAEEGSQSGAEIYKYLKMAINSDVQYSRFDVPKAALGLFANHASQFRPLLATDFKYLFHHLSEWGKRSNKELKYIALDALNAYLEQVALYAEENASISSKKAMCLEILEYLLTKFHGVLNADLSSPKDLSVAVKGYGYFSAACKALLKEDDVKFMFEQILQRSQHIYSSIEDNYEDKMEYLPGFLEALANIIACLDKVSDVYLLPMEKMVLVLFESFPKFGKAGKFLLKKGMSHFLVALGKNPSLLKSCLSHIVYQLVLRTCCHPILDQQAIAEKGNLDELLDENVVSYKSYLDIWHFLLEERSYVNADLSRLESGTLKPKTLVKSIFDELILSLLAVLKKLNLKVERDGSEEEKLMLETEARADVITVLKANVPKDFEILINLVDFARDLLYQKYAKLFCDWIPTLVKDIIALSCRFPLVSGFYKLLEITCINCIRSNYFQNISSVTEEYSDVRITSIHLRKYRTEVLGRIKQYKDDLLASCLRFLVGLPFVIVMDDIARMETPVKIGLKLGLSHLPLAEATLNGVERWVDHMESSEKEKFLQSVLPSFDDYLQVSNEKEDASEEGTSLSTKPMALDKRKGRVPVRLIKALRNAEKNQESPVNKLRIRIIKFLGHLGGFCSYLIKDGRTPNLGKAVAWDTEKHLGFAMPFPDMKPTIYLDPFVPRVVELATSSSDRQTKVIACEFLHALVLFMLGKNEQQSSTVTKQMSLERVYKHVFPAVLQLGCDVEQVAEQLFRPLVMQLIHWFTSSAKFGSNETMVLLDAIFDGIVNQTDTLLRDFCAKCLREFLHWSIKQTSVKQMERNPINPKKIFKRLNSFAVHPNAFKRLGAAQAFNNIYRIFREEQSLVDVFALEMLIVFVTSLAIAHTDEIGLGTVDHCKETLGHIERIIKKKADLLSKPSNRRRVLGVFSGTENFTLHHVIPWLLKECGRLQTECRHRCMELVYSLSTCQLGVASTKVWMERTFESNGPQFFTEKFEGGGKGDMGILKFPHLSSISKRFTLGKCIYWLESLLAALDCYTWIATSRILDPCKLILSSGSNILSSIQYFISEICRKSLPELSMAFFTSFKKSGTQEPFSSHEEERFNRLKCTAVVRCFDLLTGVLTQNRCKELQAPLLELFNANLFHVIGSSILNPESVGFEVTDTDILEHLPSKLLDLCKVICGGLSETKVSEFIGTLSTLVYSERYDLIAHLPFDFVESEGASEKSGQLLQLIGGYQLLHNAKLLEQILKPHELQKLSSIILLSVLNGLPSLAGMTEVSLIPLQKFLADHMLSFYLLLSRQDCRLSSLVLDVSPLQHSSEHSVKQGKGMTLYHLFQGTINDYLMNASLEFQSIVKAGFQEPNLLNNLLQSFLPHLMRKKQRSEGEVLVSDVAKVIISSWDGFASWVQTGSSSELKLGIVNIVKHIFAINGKDALQHENGPQIFAAVGSLLADRGTSLSFKCQVLDVLPMVLTHASKEHCASVRDFLNGLVVTYFPLSSQELIPASQKYNEYMECLGKLLHIFLESENNVILEVLLPVIVRETESTYVEKIRPVLISISKKLKETKVLELLDLTYRIFTNEVQFPSAIRKGVILRVCLPLLQRASTNSKKLFFRQVLAEVMGFLDKKYVKNPESSFEAQIATKICCFKLLHCMYASLGKEDLMSPHSEIVKSFAPGAETGKELTQAATKLAHATKSEDTRGETALHELRGELHCAAFDALAAIIACTQTEQKFYTGFLFTENLTKGQLLLDNLVDRNRVYNFEVELTVPFARKKQLQAIRQHDVGTDEDDIDEQPRRTLQGKGFQAYLSSQYLMGSSLSQDVNQYDFNTPIQAYSSMDQSQGAKGRKSAESSSASFKMSQEEPELLLEKTLELDDLNQSAAMQTFISLLKTMKRLNVYKDPPQGQNVPDMPPWMACLHRKLCANDTSINVKLFIAKLIANEYTIFEPYGHHWFGPLIQMIVHSEIPGHPISYFVVDIVVAMLSWSGRCIPKNDAQGKNMACGLLDYLIKHCHHTNRGILKNNLQLIKTLSQVWKDLLEIPYKLIYDKFSSSESEKKDNMTGIQLLGVVLTNGYPPFNGRVGVSEASFFRSLKMNLTFKYRDIYASCAEVIGLALKYFQDHEEMDNLLAPMIHDQLLELHGASKEKFVTILHRIRLNYPDIVDKFVNQLLFSLPNLFGSFKAQCLDCIASRIALLPNKLEVYAELKVKGLEVILSHRDDETLLPVLQLIRGVILDMSPHETVNILAALSSVKDHPNPDVRERMFDLFMLVYDAHRADPDLRKESEEFEILKTSKEVLLLGINDSSTSLSLRILNFWRHETRLPSSTIERTIEILRALYSPKTEKEFLNYSTNLILQLTSLSPDYSLPLFDKPLDATKKFQEVQINCSWQRQKAAMTPLFAISQVFSQSLSPDYGGSRTLEENVLRATETKFSFSQTQDKRGTSSFLDWMTPSTQVEASFFVSTRGTAESQSSLLVKQSQRRARPKLRVSSPTALDEIDSGIQEKPEVLRLKRRFLKDQEASSKFFAKREVRKQEKRQQILERQKAARDHRVVMYRKYRTGELPDIQIKHSELIVPLQALAQNDSNLAQILFVNIVSSLMEQLPEKLTPQVLEKAQSDIHSSLEVMISSSSAFYPPFVHAVEEICYRQKDINLNPVSVATASNMANKQPMGILMLERQLLTSAVAQSPKAKRRKGVQTLSDASNTWTQLAKLYKSIEEYEFVRTIFGSQLSNSEVTQQAFAAEVRNDYREAAKLYNKALSLQSSEDESFLLEEGEFLDHCRVKCYEHLCQWSNLLTLTLQGIDEDSPADISRIMDDATLQEQYLPSYIKSNVKLWCQGKEDKVHVSFTQFIESALQSEDTKDYMKSHFAEDLALLSVLQNDNNRARYFLNLGVQNFLEDWSDLGHLLAKSRFSRLQTLQKLCELEEFLDLVNKGSVISVDAVENLLRRWSRRSPLEAMDSITVWDDVMLNRSVYFRKIRDVYHQCPRNDGDLLDQKLKLDEAKYSLQIADVAREQGNLTVAFQYLMDAENSQSKTIKECLPVQWCHVYTKAQNDAAKTASQEDAATILVKAIELLNVNKPQIAGDPSLVVNHNLLERETWERLVKVVNLVDLPDRSVDSLFGDKQQDVFMKYYHMTMKGDTDRCLSLVTDFSTRALQSAEAAANNLNPEVKSERDLQEKCLLTLVTYCNNKLKAEDTHEDVKNELADGCIRHLLKAMTLNSKAARQMFPSLLQIIEFYPDTRDTFKQKVEAVPEWMFLSWVNQLIALLDKEHGLPLEGILWRIAKAYPQSLIYPLKTSSEQYKFASDRTGKALEANFKKLSQQVANPACLLLIEGLEQLTNPEHVFKDWREDIKPLLSAKERSPQTIKDVFMTLWKKLFCQVEHGKDNGLDPGNVRRRFARAYSSKMEQIFGKGGTALLKMSEKTFRENHDALFAEMKGRKAEWLGKGKPSSLKEFSPWLANFRLDKFMYPIEIPGQYTGDMKPLTEYHVKIVGFNEEIRSMDSMRAPKRITVRGDDEREYKFLVKGGEDLRLDQRIEQLFGIMNGILAEDINSTSRGLQLKRYNVIPMTNRIGIIEWLDNTMPLKELLLTSLTDKERTNSQNLSAIIPRHMSFSAKYGNILKMYSSATRKDVERAYDMLKNSVPWDLLRRSLENLSSSSEAYFLLRNNFIRTHSCLCICHYILGIGDRHLSNFLVDTTSGGVIGIDFGHAFGSATQLLPTPELMPFRLTPQITNLLLPLKDHGPFKETMSYVLQALRERPELLLNTMDVFIKEPLLDWQVYARMQAQRINKSEEQDESDAWYPLEKIRICKMKLDGINPAYVTGEEIKGGKYGLKSGPIQAVAFGDRHCSVRRRLLDKADQISSRATFSLSVEDQVACLVDLATDPNVIFRAYAGWEPWV